MILDKESPRNRLAVAWRGCVFGGGRFAGKVLARGGFMWVGGGGSRSRCQGAPPDGANLGGGATLRGGGGWSLLVGAGKWARKAGRLWGWIGGCGGASSASGVDWARADSW